MSKYTTYLLCFLFSSVLCLHPGKNCQTMFLEEHKKLEASINDTFTIFLQVGQPHHASEEEWAKFRWLDEDHWKIVEYDSSALKLIEQDSTAPNWAGEDLLQRWVFQACKIGRFKIVLQRYDQKFVSEVIIK